MAANRYPSVINGGPADADLWFNAVAKDLTAALAQLASAPLGIVGRGRRITSSSTTTTEVGVLRIDNIPAVSGRLYAVWTSPLGIISTIANDVPRANIRASTAGVATTASTELDLMQIPVTSTVNSPLIPAVALYPNSSTGPLSVLLSVSRAAGTGSVSISGGGINPIDLWVEDIGLDPGDTGVSL